MHVADMLYSCNSLRFEWRDYCTLKPPPVPSLLVSTVPGFGVLHWLQEFLRAQLRLPQPGHVQSSGANKPADHCRGCLAWMSIHLASHLILCELISG